MAAVIPLLLAWLAQGSPASGGHERFKITLEYYGYWGLTTEADGRCPSAPAGTDALSGHVTREGEDDEGVWYSGTLMRTTNIGLCEAQDTADGARWCGGELHGRGEIDVRIVVPALGNDNESLRIELKPRPSVTVQVGGQCSSLDNAAVAADYTSPDTILFETANAAGVRSPPTGGLVVRPDAYSQTVRVEPDRGYTLKVEQP